MTRIQLSISCISHIKLTKITISAWPPLRGILLLFGTGNDVHAGTVSHRVERSSADPKKCTQPAVAMLYKCTYLITTLCYIPVTWYKPLVDRLITSLSLKGFFHQVITFCHVNHICVAHVYMSRGTLPVRILLIWGNLIVPCTRCLGHQQPTNLIVFTICLSVIKS